MFCTMSAVTSQPLPFGGLEREKHIQMIFRAFQDRCGHTHSPRPKAHPVSPEWDERRSALSTGRKVENIFFIQSPSTLEEPCPGGAEASDFMSLLETVSQINITARPELQGPQCVPRRVYSITTGGSRSHLFAAVEESSCVCLQCCGPARACTLQGYDCQGHPVFYFERPLRVDACCLGCCLMEIKAYVPQKHLIGSVYQRWSMFTPLLEVCDSDGASDIRIQGPCCPNRCLSTQQFQIVSSLGEKIGTIWKKWWGFNEEHNMDHEYFGLEVPLSMQSQTKLLLLAATFLLNHMFFEMS